jgi:hypothetical protein
MYIFKYTIAIKKFHTKLYLDYKGEESDGQHQQFNLVQKTANIDHRKLKEKKSDFVLIGSVGQIA